MSDSPRNKVTTPALLNLIRLLAAELVVGSVRVSALGGGGVELGVDWVDSALQLASRHPAAHATNRPLDERLAGPPRIRDSIHTPVRSTRTVRDQAMSCSHREWYRLAMRIV